MLLRAQLAICVFALHSPTHSFHVLVHIQQQCVVEHHVL